MRRGGRGRRRGNEWNVVGGKEREEDVGETEEVERGIDRRKGKNRGYWRKRGRRLRNWQEERQEKGMWEKERKKREELLGGRNNWDEQWERKRN